MSNTELPIFPKTIPANDYLLLPSDHFGDLESSLIFLLFTLDPLVNFSGSIFKIHKESDQLSHLDVTTLSKPPSSLASSMRPLYSSPCFHLSPFVAYSVEDTLKTNVQLSYPLAQNPPRTSCLTQRKVQSCFSGLQGWWTPLAAAPLISSLMVLSCSHSAHRFLAFP